MLVALIGPQWATLTDEDGVGGWTTPTITSVSRSRPRCNAVYG